MSRRSSRCKKPRFRVSRSLDVKDQFGAHARFKQLRFHLDADLRELLLQELHNLSGGRVVVA